MKNNLLPRHDGPIVNAIEESFDHHVVEEVEKVKTHMSVIREKLIEYNLIKEVHDDCEMGLYTLNDCEGLK